MRQLQNLLALMAGLTAIVAQLVWVRFVTQLLGLSSWTISSVIGMSLLGLAIGNRWAGRKTRLGTSLKFASFMLAGVGLATLLMPLLFWLAGVIEATFFPAFPNGVAEKLWILAVSFPALIVHFFAGAVLPALLQDRASTSATAGRITAMETLGGCLGAVLTGCLTMQWLGMKFTVLGAGGAALLMAVYVLSQGKKRFNEEASLSVNSPDTLNSVEAHNEIDSDLLNVQPQTDWNTTVWLGIFCAGVASLGLEVIWQRLLILLVGTDGYSLTIVVVAYLIGIASGAECGSRWLTADQAATGTTWRRRVAGLQLVGAFASVVVLTVIVFLASGTGQAWLNAPLFGVNAPLLKRGLLCCGLLLIPTFVYGASWPLLLRGLIDRPITTDGQSRLAFLAAQIYSLVAIGNVVGVIVTGFFLIPTFGLQYALVALVVMTVFSAWLIVGADLNRPLGALTACVVLLAGWKALFLEPVGIAADRKTDLLFYREGPAHTVAVLADPDRPTHRQLSVDGIVVGQSGDNIEEKQLMLAHLAPMISPPHKIKNAVVIGLGSGILSRQLAAIEGVQSVTSVELSRAVIEAADQFADLAPPTAASKVTVQADGVWWLKKSTEKYDVIVSDGKSRPGHVGNSAFFSIDYYQNVARRLSDSGLFVQWVSLDADVRETGIVLRTFAQGFPYPYVAISAPGSIYLVGGNERLTISNNSIERYLQSPTAASLNDYGWRTADDIKGMGWVAIGPGDIEQSSGIMSIGAAINSLDRPLLERVSFDVRPETLTENRLKNLTLLELLLQHNDSLGLSNEDLARQSKLGASINALIEMARQEITQDQGWVNRAIVEYQKALANLPNLSRGGYLANISFRAAAQAAKENRPDREAEMLLQGAAVVANDYATQMRIARRLEALKQLTEASSTYLAAVKCRPHDQAANLAAAETLVKIGKHKQAIRYFKAAQRNQRAAKISQQLNQSEPNWDVVDPTDSITPQTDEEAEKRLLELLGE